MFLGIPVPQAVLSRYTNAEAPEGVAGWPGASRTYGQCTVLSSISCNSKAENQAAVGVIALVEHSITCCTYRPLWESYIRIVLSAAMQPVKCPLSINRGHLTRFQSQQTYTAVLTGMYALFAAGRSAAAVQVLPQAHATRCWCLGHPSYPQSWGTAPPQSHAPPVAAHLFVLRQWSRHCHSDHCLAPLLMLAGALLPYLRRCHANHRRHHFHRQRTQSALGLPEKSTKHHLRLRGRC